MSILVLNAGSSTLKFALFDAAARAELASGLVDWRGTHDAATLDWRTPGSPMQQSDKRIAGYGEATGWILQTLAAQCVAAPITQVGHRVVHGGTEFRHSTLIDDRVCAALERIAELAPLHNPPALATIAAARSALPSATHLAAFDTSFFAAMPARAFLYPLPYDWYRQYGIRRFGFHGISHEWCAMRTAEMLGRTGDPSLRIVSCHLGSGCSATAVRGSTPVTTTMGFTPLEGLMMGTRSGSIDPGILFYLLEQQGLTARELDHALNYNSGLLGVSGVSADLRQIEQALATGNERAQLALDLFCDRIRATIGALAVTLGGVDALVFTAGVGEHSATVRGQVCEGLQCLGLELDPPANLHAAGDCTIALSGSPGQILVLKTREEQMIARDALRLGSGTVS
ncbi:MAG: acetate kinase [Pseudomonadales bacterium]|nr:acetate kinase [Pseudomonadales bacterium]